MQQVRSTKLLVLKSVLEQGAAVQRLVEGFAECGSLKTIGGSEMEREGLNAGEQSARSCAARRSDRRACRGRNGLWCNSIEF